MRSRRWWEKKIHIKDAMADVPCKIISTYTTLYRHPQFYIIALFIHIRVCYRRCFCWHHYFVWFTFTLIDWPNFHTASSPCTSAECMRVEVIATKPATELVLGFTLSIHIVCSANFAYIRRANWKRADNVQSEKDTRHALGKWRNLAAFFIHC